MRGFSIFERIFIFKLLRTITFKLNRLLYKRVCTFHNVSTTPFVSNLTSQLKHCRTLSGFSFQASFLYFIKSDILLYETKLWTNILVIPSLSSFLSFPARPLTRKNFVQFLCSFLTAECVIRQPELTLNYNLLKIVMSLLMKRKFCSFSRRLWIHSMLLDNNKRGTLWAEFVGWTFVVKLNELHVFNEMPYVKVCSSIFH